MAFAWAMIYLRNNDDIPNGIFMCKIIAIEWKHRRDIVNDGVVEGSDVFLWWCCETGLVKWMTRWIRFQKLSPNGRWNSHNPFRNAPTHPVTQPPSTHPNSNRTSQIEQITTKWIIVFRLGIFSISFCRIQWSQLKGLPFRMQYPQFSFRKCHFIESVLESARFRHNFLSSFSPPHSIPLDFFCASVRFLAMPLPFWHIFREIAKHGSVHPVTQQCIEWRMDAKRRKDAKTQSIIAFQIRCESHWFD